MLIEAICSIAEPAIQELTFQSLNSLRWKMPAASLHLVIHLIIYIQQVKMDYKLR